jgi:hypothetical protein
LLLLYVKNTDCTALAVTTCYYTATTSHTHDAQQSGAASTHEYADVLEKDALDPNNCLTHYNASVAPDLKQLQKHVSSVKSLNDRSHHGASSSKKSKAQQARQSGSQLLLSVSDGASSTTAAAGAGNGAVHAPSSGGTVGQHTTTTASNGDTASDTLSGSVRSSTRSLSKAISSRILSTKRQKRQAASALVTQWQQQQSSSSFADTSTANIAIDDVESDTPLAAGDSPKVEADVAGVYLFNSPRLFKQMLSLVLLFSNIEIALLAANFGIVAARDNSKTAAAKFWTMLALLLPIVLGFPLLKGIVRIGSVLDAISVLKPDILGSVVEGMEESFGLAQDFSYKLRTRLSTAGLGAAELTELVDTLAVDGYIRPSGLRQILTLTSLHMPDRKFKRLFRALGTLLHYTYNRTIHHRTRTACTAQYTKLPKLNLESTATHLV